jgi:ABC-type nitrate/sulfonate/bicarbonate transport system permease component
MSANSIAQALLRPFRRRARRLRDEWDRALLAVLGLLVFFLLWHEAAVLADEPALPTPGKVLEALRDSFKEPPSGFYDPWTMQEHVYQSLKKIAYASLVAIGLAVPLGLLLGFSPRAEAFLSIPLELIRPIPPIAWLAFAIAILTTGTDVIFIISLGIFFPVFLSTLDGVKKVDRMLIDAAETLGARRAQVFYKVIFPATMPQTMTGVRIGVGVGWMTIVAAEMLGVQDGGLGWMIYNHGMLDDYDTMFAGMLMLGITSFLIARGLIALERWLQR